MKKVTIKAERITNWKTFHSYFQELFGFPEFYGNNMNAWIDCMTSLDSPNDGMTNIHVEPSETLILEIDDPNLLKKRCPKILDALVECSAFVNYRKLEVGEQAVLTLSYYLH